ncbi:MAG: RHS repeat-associated core domain-containing protein [bacterium]|nr:RHS repeat-associated core domain-containing protein [bacterium]
MKQPRSILVSYTPCGEMLQSYGTSAAPRLGFTGEYTDPSGMVFLRARYMNPDLGIFLSKDPFEGWTQRVMSRNGYSYVEGNPVNYTDPSGQALPLFVLGGAALAGAAIGGLSSAALASNLYDLAKNCQCGEWWRDWANRTNKTRFVLAAAALGAVGGAVVGAFAVANPVTALRLITGLNLGAGVGSALNQLPGLAGSNLCDQMMMTLSAGDVGLGGGVAGGTGAVPVGGGGLAVGATPAVVAAGAVGVRTAAVRFAVGLTGFLNSSNSNDGEESQPSRSFDPRSLQNKTPEDLIAEGWVENFENRSPNRRTFVNSDGIKISYEEGIRGAYGWSGIDHFHVYNPNNPTGHDRILYLDINGNPVPKNSKPSHIPRIPGQRP